MLSRKHYKAIAEKIKNERDDWPDEWCTLLCDSLAKELADYFLIDNPRFDYGKFMIACGID